MNRRQFVIFGLVFISSILLVSIILNPFTSQKVAVDSLTDGQATEDQNWDQIQPSEKSEERLNIPLFSGSNFSTKEIEAINNFTAESAPTYEDIPGGGTIIRRGINSRNVLILKTDPQGTTQKIEIGHAGIEGAKE